MNIKLFAFLVFIPMLALSQSDGMFWAARLSNGSVSFYRSNVPTDGASLYVNSNVNVKYLKITNNTVVEMTEDEKHMIDLPSKYKKTVDGVVVEMTQEEKNDVDAAIVATNELLRIQAEIDRQNNKNPMLKQVENLYITFLTNDWTKLLQSKSIVTSNTVINVTNTPYMQNMVYLMTLRAIDRDNYVKYASEFKLFEETMNDVFSSSISDAVWHD